MPQITQIKSQKNNKRVNIYLDGKFGFGLDLENFMKLGLKVDDELTDAEVEKIVKKAEFQKIYNKILRFASLRPRSEKEFKDWLKKHKIHKSLHEELFRRLKRLEFIDDRKFALWWVEQRLASRPRGVRALSSELRQKGIEKELVGEVLSEIKIDEVTMAKKILEKKSYKWIKLEGLDRRKKMAEFLARKGFGWDAINKVIKD